MTGTYSVELDIPQRFLHLRCVGLWSADVALGCTNAIDEALHRYDASGAPTNTLLTLIDLRESAIQSQTIANSLQEHTNRYIAVSRRVAILLSTSAIQRAQVRRIVRPDRYRSFLVENEARAWLDEARRSFAQAG